MTDVALFGEGNPLANSDLFQSLIDTTDKLTGGDSHGSYRRISIKGGKFRKIVGGEQIEVTRDESMNIVVVDAASVGRTYYEGTYDPDAKAAPPTCWSDDGNVPAGDVETPQATRCGDCAMNIKGSGQGDSRACRYSQRIAVAIENDLDTVYQLSLPATSLFGDGKNKHLPMQGYAKFLKAHKTPVIAVITEMLFDEDAEVPKLLFKPVRPLTEEELGQVVALRETEDCKRAVEMTVAQTDGVEPVKELFHGEEKEEVAPAKKPAKKAAKKAAEPEVEEEIAEPSVVKKTKAAEPEPTSDLSALMDEWDDDQ